MGPLKKRRLEKKWTQDHLAEISDVTTKTISKIEADEYVPSDRIQIKLSTALGCQPEDLFQPKAQVVSLLPAQLSEKDFRYKNVKGPGKANFQNSFLPPLLHRGEAVQAFDTFFEDHLPELDLCLIEGSVGSGKSWLAKHLHQKLETSGTPAALIPANLLDPKEVDLVASIEMLIKMSSPGDFENSQAPHSNAGLVWILDGVEHLWLAGETYAQFRLRLSSLLKHVARHNVRTNLFRLVLTVNTSLTSFLKYLTTDRNLFILGSLNHSNQAQQWKEQLWGQYSKIYRFDEKGRNELHEDMVNQLTDTPLLCALMAECLDRLQREGVSAPCVNDLEALATSIYERDWDPLRFDAPVDSLAQYLDSFESVSILPKTETKHPSMEEPFERGEVVFPNKRVFSIDGSESAADSKSLLFENEILGQWAMAKHLAKQKIEEPFPKGQQEQLGEYGGFFFKQMRGTG